MEDFVYWRHPTLPCIKVEEITEGDDYKGPAWMDMARQIYGENGKDNYREIRHFDNGAPYVAGSTARSSGLARLTKSSLCNKASRQHS